MRFFCAIKAAGRTHLHGYIAVFSVDVFLLGPSKPPRARVGGRGHGLTELSRGEVFDVPVHCIWFASLISIVIDPRPVKTTELNSSDDKTHIQPAMSPTDSASYIEIELTRSLGDCAGDRDLQLERNPVL